MNKPKGSVCEVQRGRGALCVRRLLNDSSLRVRGEGSKQNLRHVLLAKGHQEQRQALIGRVHAATLTDKRGGGLMFFSSKNNTEISHRGGEVHQEVSNLFDGGKKTHKHDINSHIPLARFCRHPNNARPFFLLLTFFLQHRGIQKQRSLSQYLGDHVLSRLPSNSNVGAPKIVKKQTLKRSFLVDGNSFFDHLVLTQWTLLNCSYI